MKYSWSLVFIFLHFIAKSQTVSVDTFAVQLKQYPHPQLIDVRTPKEFAEGHLPGATNIDSQSKDFTQSIAKLDKTQPIFVYCLSGGRSSTAMAKLRKLGYTNVLDLQGGYLKWASRMMPVEGVSKSNAQPEWPETRFDSLLHARSLVLVDVYAPWCGPCKKMAPIIDKLSTEMASTVKIVKLNADTEKPFMATYKVEELPTLLLFENGKLRTRQTGFHNEAALRALIKQKP